MKNFFLFSFLLGTCPLFAQVNINAVSPGQINISTITQSGDKDLSNVNQQGTFNSSIIEQVGAKNSIDANQINQIGVEIPTYSEIYQKGEVLKVSIDQHSSIPSLFKDGILSEIISIINQEGNNHTANLLQFGTSNYSYISQKGSENNAKQEQGGSTNIGLISQESTHNNAYQYQSDEGKGSRVEIIQQGTLNETSQIQELLSIENVAYVFQSSKNFASQIQSGLVNNAEIIQEGIGNYAYQYQRFGRDQAKINQIGSDSYARQYQHGFDNKAEIFQSGPNDYAEQYQGRYSDNNIAYISQKGYSAVAFQNQRGFQNSADIYQEGKNYAKQDQVSWNMGKIANKATIIQETGSENYGYQKQFTSEFDFVLNEVILFQRAGNFNHSEQNQYGQGNFSLIQQVGNSNNAIVDQKTSNTTSF